MAFIQGIDWCSTFKFVAVDFGGKTEKMRKTWTGKTEWDDHDPPKVLSRPFHPILLGHVLLRGLPAGRFFT